MSFSGEPDEDEDHRFFRAAAEAIVATSMNNPIDPTILELLRRIQYASVSKANGNSNGHNGPRSAADNLNLIQQQLFQQPQFLQPRDQQNQTVGIDTSKAANFPTFNLNYFGLQGSSSSGTEPLQSNSLLDSWKVSSPSTASKIKSDSLQDPGPKSSSTDRHTSTDHTPKTNTFAQTPSSLSDAASPQDGESKPFICRDCTLSFRRSSDLRRHQRAHLPVLPHVCQQCGKGFARKDALKRHTDTLTCKRNRERLLGGGSELDGVIARANEIKRSQLGSMDEEEDYDMKEEEGDEDEEF